MCREYVDILNEGVGIMFVCADVSMYPKEPYMYPKEPYMYPKEPYVYPNEPCMYITELYIRVLCKNKRALYIHKID